MRLARGKRNIANKHIILHAALLFQFSFLEKVELWKENLRIVAFCQEKENHPKQVSSFQDLAVYSPHPRKERSTEDEFDCNTLYTVII